MLAVAVALLVALACAFPEQSCEDRGLSDGRRDGRACTALRETPEDFECDTPEEVDDYMAAYYQGYCESHQDAGDSGADGGCGTDGEFACLGQ